MTDNELHQLMHDATCDITASPSLRGRLANHRRAGRGARRWWVAGVAAAAAAATLLAAPLLRSTATAPNPATPPAVLTAPTTMATVAAAADPAQLTGTVPSTSRPLAPASTVPAPTARSTRVSIADWPQFDTIQALAASSNLVVIAQAGTIYPSTQSPDPAGTPANKKGHGTVTTTFTFTVEKVITHHDGPPPGASLEVTSSVGTVNGVRSIVGGAPWYQQGARYLLFLRWFPGNTTYSDVGGVQAVYLATAQGRLMSIPDPYLHTPVMDRINGSTLEQLTTLLQAPHR